jgi:hypothetical protein
MPTSKPLIERFWSKVGKTDTCWLWTGSLHPRTGYGRLRLGTQGSPTVNAHRAAYMLLVGPVPEGLYIDHLCRNRACVNPAHLEPVTNAENVLRGSSFAAANARKTHCPQGHLYDEPNTVLIDGRWRRCRACKSEADLRRRQRGKRGTK